MKAVSIFSILVVVPLIAGLQWAQALRRPGKSLLSSLGMSDASLNPLLRVMNEFEKDIYPMAMPSRNLPSLAELNVDVKETPKSFDIELDIPGVKKDDIDIDIKDRYLQYSNRCFSFKGVHSV